MARSIALLMFVAVLYISLTNAASSLVQDKQQEQITVFDKYYFTRQATGCLVSLQSVATTFDAIRAQFGNLQQVIPDVFMNSFSCVGLSGGALQDIAPCLENIIPTETAKLQGIIQRVQKGLQDLAGQVQQIETQCLSGVSGSLTG